jgi:hypothetical protein
MKRLLRAALALLALCSAPAEAQNVNTGVLIAISAHGAGTRYFRVCFRRLPVGRKQDTPPVETADRSDHQARPGLAASKTVSLDLTRSTYSVG